MYFVGREKDFVSEPWSKLYLYRKEFNGIEGIMYHFEKV